MCIEIELKSTTNKTSLGLRGANPRPLLNFDFYFCRCIIFT
nr:MAG TPA: hypothetical protein [Caudoviricetes sp.]